MHVRDAIDPRINFSMGFLEWEAATAAGATLAELLDWENGVKFPKHFKARVVAWYQYHCLVKTHQEDATRPKKGGRH